MARSTLRGGFFRGKRSTVLTVVAPPESAVQKAICDLLNVRQVVYAVTDARTVETVDGPRQLVRPEGWPDITAILPVTGRIWGIETKTVTGELREAQEDMHALIEASGGLVTVARDSLEIQKVLNQHLAQYKTYVLIPYMDVIKRLKRVFAERAFARKQKTKRRKTAKRVEAQLNFVKEP